MAGCTGLPVIKFTVVSFILSYVSVAFGCKCESSSTLDCCRNTSFSALFNEPQNIAILDKLQKPFYIVTPSLVRKKQLLITTSDANFTLGNISLSPRRNESRTLTDNCTANTCVVKVGNSRKKDAPCQLQICGNTMFNATFRYDSRSALLTKLHCVNSLCAHVLSISGTAASEATVRASQTASESDEEDQLTESETGSKSRADSGTAVTEAALLDTVWLVVILGGVALGVLLVVGIVFACFARRDRRRKAAVHDPLRPTAPSTTGWRFQRPAPSNANPRFQAAVNEFYRAAMTPDDEDDVASASDDSLADDTFGRPRVSQVPPEHDESDAFERSSAQRTIKFSAAPTVVSSSSSGHRVLVEALVENRAPAAPGGSLARRGPSSTPLPVRSILKKGGAKKSADASVGTQGPSGAPQPSLPEGMSPAPRRRNSSASSSSGYSLVECEDKSVGVTEAELDAMQPSSLPVTRLFVTADGQLLAGSPFTLPAPAMHTSAHSHSPSTNLSPVSTGNTPAGPRAHAATDCECTSVGDESSDCDCLSQSVASATGTASQNNDEKPLKSADCASMEDREMDAVSISDLDLFTLTCNYDANLLSLGVGMPPPPFTPKLLPPPLSSINGSAYLPNPVRLNRLSSLASDSNNPSALNTPSPPTVSASVACQPKLELRDASLELNLNLNIAPTSPHPMLQLSGSRARESLVRGETDLDSDADCSVEPLGRSSRVALSRMPSGNASGVALWQARQPWIKGAPDQFDFS